MKKKKLTPLLSSYVFIIGLSVWIIGFGLFSLYALSFRFTPAEPTDAIVVLTGGGDRINTALELLKENYAKNLLISGVNKAVHPPDLIRSLPEELAENVTLGYEAEDTRGNARETADWIHTKNIQSVLLVTSFYHMPRSIFEVLNQNPNLKIIPLPVFPKSFDNSVEWVRTRYAWLLFVEYHKFIATHLQKLIERIWCFIHD